MDYKEFFSRYIYDRRNDAIQRSRFGTIYKAEEKRRHSEVFLRVMPVNDSESAPRLGTEVEFANALPDSPYIVKYSKSYTFEEATSEIDCAVMDAYPLGNLTKLLDDWKLNNGERRQLRDAIAEAAEFLRANNVNLGPFNPETIFVSEDGGILTPHLIDISGFEENNADFRAQLDAFLPVADEEPTAEPRPEPESRPELAPEPEPAPETSDLSDPSDEQSEKRPRKWLLLSGVVATWIVIIGGIYVIHAHRNEVAGETPAADTVKVLYPADEYALQEARRADSIAKAEAKLKADSIARADSIAAALASRRAMKRPAEEPKEEPAEEQAVEIPADVPEPVIEQHNDVPIKEPLPTEN